MSKDFLGEFTLPSLIKLIKAELSKYVKSSSMDARIPPPTAEDNGKFVQVVDGKYVPVEPDFAGTKGEDWELLTDQTLDADVQNWTFNFQAPVRKFRLAVDTLAAEANTNHSYLTFYLRNENRNGYYDVKIERNVAAVPVTTERLSVFDVEAYYIGDTLFVESEGRGGYAKSTTETDRYTVIDPVERYYSFKAVDEIIKVEFRTYGTFVVGTRFRLWGVVKS